MMDQFCGIHPMDRESCVCKYQPYRIGSIERTAHTCNEDTVKIILANGFGERRKRCWVELFQRGAQGIGLLENIKDVGIVGHRTSWRIKNIYDRAHILRLFNYEARPFPASQPVVHAD